MSVETLRLYGSDLPLPERIPLRAGPFEMVFEQGDLRTVRLEGVEVVRRIYVAIRDHNWATAANQLSNLVIDRRVDSFRIRFDGMNQQGAIDFSWHGEIEGDAQGRVRFQMTGRANSTFLRNRIGFCVLHPAGLAGSACLVERLDGQVLAGKLPEDIDPNQPVQPFTDMRGLSYGVGQDREIVLLFEGDAFEMEDQRNWTDASFKTFCTPLRHAYPVEVQAGTVIQQAVEVGVKGSGEIKPVSRRLEKRVRGEVKVEVDWGGAGMKLPGLGFGTASDGLPLDPDETERMRYLRPHHLRTDLYLDERGWMERFLQACAEARAIGTQLVVGLHVPEEEQGELGPLGRLCEEKQPEIAACLVYPRLEKYEGGSSVRRLVERVRSALPGTPLGAGTDADLIYLKRNIPPLDLVQMVTFSINPQVHAFDNLSLVETLETQATAVESARRVANGLPVVVSAVTLKPRWNAYASGPAVPIPQGELPPQVDARQLSQFGAGWTLGSISAMARGGAAWATYYETAGWRGLMERKRGSLNPRRFPSRAGELFPLYEVFRALADFTGGIVLPLKNSDPLRVAALAVRLNGRRGMLLANLGMEDLVVYMDPLREPLQLSAYRLINFEA